MSIDIGSAFTFAFDDEEWIKKLAIGGGIFLLGLILLPVLLLGLVVLLPIGGYMLEVIRNVRDNNPRPLPEWADFGGLLKTGFFVAVISLAYNLPAIILSCASGVLNGLAPNMDPDMANTIILLATCISCVQILVSIVCNLFVPAAIIRFAKYDTLSAGFQFREIISFIRENIGDYIIVFLVSWVAGIIAAFGIILCIVGVFFTAFWSYLISANLYGQLARKMTA